MKLLDSERTRCEVWSRVMGYHRPIDEWNVGKKQEHADRIHFNEPNLFNRGSYEENTNHHPSVRSTHSGN